MFVVPGPLGAKLGNFELGGWGAHVCYSLPSSGLKSKAPPTAGPLRKLGIQEGGD